MVRVSTPKQQARPRANTKLVGGRAILVDGLLYGCQVSSQGVSWHEVSSNLKQAEQPVRTPRRE
jgi:hypothetical protein